MPRIFRPFRVARCVASLWGRAALFVCVLCAVSLLPAAAKDVNTVRTILTMHPKVGPAYVEVTVHSTRSFGARNEVIHMDIGGQQFMDSHNPSSGSEFTLIFRMTQAQFKALPSKSPVVVSYGRDSQSGLSGDWWDFGKLDKSLLDKK